MQALGKEPPRVTLCHSLVQECSWTGTLHFCSWSFQGREEGNHGRLGLMVHTAGQ
jgi:hypothetical protein